MANFCSECGSALGQGVKFCNNCGAPASNDLVSNSDNGFKNKKEEILSSLDSAYKYFFQMSDSYKVYENLLFSINYMPPVSIKRSIIIGVIAWVAVALAIYEVTDSVKYGNVAFIIAVIAGIIDNRMSASKRSRNLIDLTNQLSVVGNNLYNYYIEYEDCPVAIEYSNPELITIIRKMISSGRADSIKEAINLMIEDEHRVRMETGQREILNETRRTADNAGTAAFFSAASFFFKH